MWPLLSWFSAVFALLYLAFRWRYGYWRRLGVPFEQPTFPLGNIWKSSLMRQPIGVELADLYSHTGQHKAVGFFMLNKPALMVRHPELLRAVLVKDFGHLTDRGFYFDEHSDPLSGHLFFLGGAKWRWLRGKLSPTFTSGRMRAMFPIVRDCATQLADVLQATIQKGSPVVEMRDLVARYGTDVIALCAFGVRAGSLLDPEAEFRQWGRRFLRPSLRTFIVQTVSFASPALRALLAVPFVQRDIARYFTDVVRDTVRLREKSGAEAKDFMQLLIQLQSADHGKDSTGVSDGKLSLDEMTAQAFVFFVAGFETSSSATSFCLLELSRHQDIQRRLQRELDEAVASGGEELSYDTVMTLPLLDKVIAETLRKYPPLPILNREVTQDYKLPEFDCVLEKGTAVIIPVLGLHYDPQYFPDPERFDPERFSEENKVKINPYVYLPFGEGPRICIGARFGLLQTKTAVASLLLRFNVSPADGSEVSFSPKTLLLTPKGGVSLKVTSRGS